jgi:type I restriction enzyme S subunit
MIGDVAELATGTTPPTADTSNYGDEFMFVSPADIDESKWIDRTGKRLSPKGFSISRQFPPGSVLFVCIGSTIGKCAMAKVELTSNQQINAVLPNSTFDSDFLYYGLSMSAPAVRAQAGEQAVPLVNKTQFAATKLLFPPISEQRAIATALSDVDALIAGLERLIAKKRDIKQAAMQQLLTGQTRLPGFSGEWESAQLGNVAFLKNGYMFRSETYIPTGDYKVITIANVQDGHMISEGCSTVAAPPIDIQPHQELLIGDILISMTGNVGRVCRVSEQKCLLNQRVGKLVPRTVTSDFLFALLRQSAFITSMTGAAKGGAQPNLSASDINEYGFFMPTDLCEQTAIAAALSDMDADLSALESRLAKIRAIKQGMMQELLTGRTRLV